MSERDILSPDEPERGVPIGSDKDDYSWTRGLPDPDEIPSNVGFVTDSPFQNGDGSAIVGPDGKPLGLQTKVVQSLTDVQKLWEIKRTREPCFLCEHFRPNVFSPEQKRRLWKLMIHETGWPVRGVADVLGSPTEYEYCEKHGQLVHKVSSCPRDWKPKKTMLKLVF